MVTRRSLWLATLLLAAPSLGEAPGDEASEGRSLNWTAFELDGYIVVPGVLTASQVARAKAAMQGSDDAHTNIAQFRQEGSLMERDPVFLELLTSLPQAVEEKMFSVLGHWIVGAYAQITLQPLSQWIRRGTEDYKRAKASGMHADYPYGGHEGCTPGWDCFDATPPQYPPTIQLIFMLDDFTEANGATLVLPGSHIARVNPKSVDHFIHFAENAKSVTGKAGDMFMYIGFAWHGSGVNIAGAPRAGVVVQCLPYFMKPMHSHMYMFPSRVARDLPQNLRNRLGLKGWANFGHTSNLHGRYLRHAFLLLWDSMLYGYPGETLIFYIIIIFFSPLFCAIVGLKDAVKVSAAASVGLLLGVAMTLQRFQM